MSNVENRRGETSLLGVEAIASFCRETAKISIVDFDLDLDVDLDFDVVGALAGTNKVWQMSHRHLFASLKIAYVHVDVQVQVQDEESRFRLQNTLCDRN